jgi:acyl carrier protein
MDRAGTKGAEVREIAARRHDHRLLLHYPAMAIGRRILDWLATTAGGLADGIDTTDYVERVERELQITVRDADAERLKTLGDLCSFVATQRRAQGRPLEDNQIWDAVRHITSEELGIDVNELHPGIRYVEDLCC